MDSPALFRINRLPVRAWVLNRSRSFNAGVFFALSSRGARPVVRPVRHRHGDGGSLAKDEACRLSRRRLGEGGWLSGPL